MRRNKLTGHYFLWAIAAVAVSGCGERGAFMQTELLSKRAGRRAGMQGPIARGASIAPAIDVTMRGSGAPAMRFESGRPGVLAASGHMLTGVSAGVAAVMIKADNGAVLDFIHLWVVEPTHIAVEQLGRDHARQGEINDVVELVVGESLTVMPVVYAGNQELSGTAETRWSMDQPVADILRDGKVQQRRLRARRPGRTRVTVDTLGLKSSFELVVVN